MKSCVYVYGIIFFVFNFVLAIELQVASEKYGILGKWWYAVIQFQSTTPIYEIAETIKRRPV